MHKYVKKLLTGLIVWAVPFFTSFLIWDVATNAPRVSMSWFNAIMAFTFSIGFAIAAYIMFKDIKKDILVESIRTGVAWYIVLIAMDWVVLVNMFGMSMTDYYPMLVTYLNAPILAILIGYIKS